MQMVVRVMARLSEMNQPPAEPEASLTDVDRD
jgi:hypothetical protein